MVVLSDGDARARLRGEANEAVEVPEVSERSEGAQSRGPELSLFELTMGATMTQAIAVACRLNLPDALADGPKSVDELGAAVGESPDALVRILRVLESIGVVLRTHVAAPGGQGHRGTTGSDRRA